MKTGKSVLVTVGVAVMLFVTTLVAFAALPKGYNLQWNELAYNGQSLQGWVELDGRKHYSVVEPLAQLESVVFTATTKIQDHDSKCQPTDDSGTVYTCTTTLSENGTYHVGALISTTVQNQELCVLMKEFGNEPLRSCQIFNPSSTPTPEATETATVTPTVEVTPTQEWTPDPVETPDATQEATQTPEPQESQTPPAEETPQPTTEPTEESTSTPAPVLTLTMVPPELTPLTPPAVTPTPVDTPQPEETPQAPTALERVDQPRPVLQIHLPSLFR